jgi:hypothetical protein
VRLGESVRPHRQLDLDDLTARRAQVLQVARLVQLTVLRDQFCERVTRTRLGAHDVGRRLPGRRDPE